VTILNALSPEGLGPAQRERRMRMLDTTAALASQGGFDAVQMRAVADGADVALGTLYRYFPSKIHLLVSVLARELERARVGFERRPAPGDTPHERVSYVLGRTTRAFQRDPNLTEALTRAFMFADASVAAELEVVGSHVNRLLTGAMGSGGTPSEEEVAIARLVGDIWLVSLVHWVTGRRSAQDVARSLDSAVRLLLRA
jgi:AcrR family transcriptional regulator